MWLDNLIKILSVRRPTNEPPHGKTNNLHRRKQRRRSAPAFAVTAKLISAFVFATRIVQFLFYLNPKFQASSSFLCLYSLCRTCSETTLLVFPRGGSNDGCSLGSNGLLDPSCIVQNLLVRRLLICLDFSDIVSNKYQSNFKGDQELIIRKICL